jgi:Ca2+-binding EF-hand superfamily protein
MIIDKAFLKFDKDCSGFIEPNDLKGVYDTSQHPKVRSGEMTENQVFGEFLESFGDVNHDFRISKNEWDDYYAAVSSNIDNDEHFILLMTRAWKL